MNIKWSASHRMWHWLNAAVILALLTTVVLRNTFFDARHNAQVIREKINIPVTEDQAMAASRAIRSQMWEWHFYLGFGLAALTVFRIIQILRRKNTSAIKFFPFPIDNWKTDPKKFFTSGSYILFYFLLFLMVISGLLLYFSEELNIQKGSKHFIKEFHEINMWFFVVFIPIHIIGVISSENKQSKGIVSDMIHGGS